MGVTGIGGFFFRAADSAALKAWYKEYLGIESDPIWFQAAGPTAFEPFRNESDYFSTDKRWMLNLRVTGLDQMVENLRAAGIEVTINADWTNTEIGSFARIHDPEGNPIELWEPAEK